MSLRVRLVLVLVILVASGLFATWFVGSQAMQGYLLNQLDTRISRMLSYAERQQAQGHDLSSAITAGRNGFQLPARNFLLFRNDKSTDYYVKPSASGNLLPALPAIGSVPNNTPITVGSQNNSMGQWRIVVDHVNDGELIVGTDQRDVDSAIAALRRIFLIISAVVLGLLGVIGYVLIRNNLRPLEKVRSTAEAIASGDLSRRVPGRRNSSEVGRLAAALNIMLTRIEDAFLAKGRSEESARRSEERMRQFVADASHELRTPLTSIRGYAELYRQGAVTSREEVAHVLGRIESQATRMGLLVEDLLLLARLDQQRPLSLEAVDLSPVLTDAVQDARVLDPDRPIQLRLPDHDVAVVLGDEAKLRQVVGNLISNALTHTPAKTPIDVNLKVLADQDQPSVVIEVADKGPGLSAEHAERIFERFYRADEARGRHNGGAGLGLSIVSALVEAHGGRVEVDPLQGHGATFRVTLAAHDATRHDLKD